jgi:hypothetical protein
MINLKKNIDERREVQRNNNESLNNQMSFSQQKKCFPKLNFFFFLKPLKQKHEKRTNSDNGAKYVLF